MTIKYKVWLEINAKALKDNIQKIRGLISLTTKLFAVVKSNAYGHGLLTFSQLADKLGVDGFCVDSVIEGVKLRQNKIQKPIIILGTTIIDTFSLASKNKLTITVSNWELLKQLKNHYPQLEFHLKIDTGMHRQGFYVNELGKTLQFIKKNKLKLTGFYSHLAMPSNKDFSEYQLSQFLEAEKIIINTEFENLTKHLAATGGLLLDKKYHFDLVRIGMSLYGCREGFQPILSWYTVISEIKDLKKGDFVGYDLTEKINEVRKMAVLPIGYWHGFDRGLSQIGEVEINGKKARVLGRVSMDMIMVDITNIKSKIGDKVKVLGSAIEMANKINTTPYEIITRINPLIKKVII